MQPDSFQHWRWRESKDWHHSAKPLSISSHLRRIWFRWRGLVSGNTVNLQSMTSSKISNIWRHQMKCLHHINYSWQRHRDLVLLFLSLWSSFYWQFYFSVCVCFCTKKSINPIFQLWESLVIKNSCFFHDNFETFASLYVVSHIFRLFKINLEYSLYTYLCS